jgi:hypothetical protein
MRTKDLIKKLQEADPSGELECNVMGHDVFYIDRSPYYYDGYSEVLIRDPAKEPYYNVIGAKFNAPEDKITIVTHSIEDALYEDPELPIEYPGSSERNYKSWVEQTRQEARDCKIDVDNWMKQLDLQEQFFKKKTYL